MPRDSKPSQPTEIEEQREPQARELDERENESEYERNDVDSDDDERDDDDLDDDDDADLSDAPRVDEESAADLTAYDALHPLSLASTRAEYEVEEADIFEEIDLDMLTPVDGFESEYA